jgi:hypothetical protein
MKSGPFRGTIDFDATARRIVELTDLNLIHEQVMLVWNARGAADIVNVESELIQMMGDSLRPDAGHSSRDSNLATRCGR